MTRSLRLLLVEDNASDAELVLRQLRLAGFEPQWDRVETESDFRAHLNDGLELILSDFAMPQFSGPRALELLTESGLDIPFIVISGTIGEDTAVLTMKQGAADYLLKDRLTRLGQAVGNALEQRRLRQQRRESLRALRENAEFVDDVLNSLTAEVVVLNDEGVITAVNEGWRRFARSIGRSEQAPEHLQQNASQPLQQNYLESGGIRVHRFTDADLPAARAGIRGVLQGVDPHFAMEYPCHRNDNSWFQMRVSPLTGARRGAVVAHEEITERKRAEVALRNLEAQLRQSQKMEAIGQLASGVAHDFNNILTVIQGNASILLYPEMSKISVSESANEIVQAAERAAGLTRQLLLFSRKQELRPADLDLNDVVSDISRMLQRLVGADVTLVAEFATEPPLIHADPGMIEQVLLNLAVNARDAMPDGGRLTISTGKETMLSAPHGTAGRFSLRQPMNAQPGEYVCLCVHDTGTGIAPEILPRIFEPFFTTKDVGKGTGLGLATVYGIVQLHHGWLAIDSPPGEGVTVRIYLPAIVGERAVRITAQAHSTLPRGTETILVAEDEVALRTLTARVLEQCGYTVHSAATGHDALAQWEAHRETITLLLTDMVMPDGMTGSQLALRLQREKPELKVIFTSGYSAESVGRGARSSDGNSFLQKPYVARVLAQAVRSRLEEV